MVKSVDTQYVTNVVGSAVAAGAGAILWGPVGAVMGAAAAALFLRELIARF